MPRKPPAFDTVMPTPERLAELMATGLTGIRHDRYLHWDALRYRKPPANLSREEWWFLTKLQRMAAWRELPLLAADRTLFRIVLPDSIIRRLHRIDRRMLGTGAPHPALADPATRERHLISAQVEEAITSSQLEGAATTARVAKAMLRAGRKPRNHGERMIYNNYLAMQFVRDLANEDLTPEAILELHRIATLDTLDAPHGAGALRAATDQVLVTDLYGNPLHVPPPAAELPERIKTLCDFANAPIEAVTFLHPIVRAILLHFAIGYDHPFVDGNGRTARALYYWLLMRSGYPSMAYASISAILHRQPARYATAYLLTETDDNDTTYFVDYHLVVTESAIDALDNDLQRRTRELEEVDALLGARQVRRALNPRQIALVAHALKQPQTEYTIAGHRQAHGVTYQTARTDLLDLERRRLLKRTTIGRAFVFIAPGDLRARLAGMATERGGA